MDYKLYIIIPIIFLFTACGEVETGDEEKSPPTIHYNDKKISCQQSKSSHKLFNYTDKEPFQIEHKDKIKLLVKNTLPSSKNSSFNNEELYKLFTTEYYWASQIDKDFDYTTYTTPQNLIDAVKYKKDRWSFAVTAEVYNDLISQKSVGIGVICQDFETGCLITYVRLDSPADKIDLRRGDIVEKINGHIATQELFYTESQKEKELTLEITRVNSNENCSGSVTPREYTYKVAKGELLKTPNNEKVAYLRMDSFLGDKSITQQLNTSFDNFKKNNIEKLIIDLRYNGGGSVDLASELINKLSTTNQNQEQFTLAWNSDYQSNNETYKFKTAHNALNLKQIIFLTTQNTASASELIISAMKPYLSESNLVVIGDKTHGKPVGMGGRIDKEYYYFLINFVVKNSLGYYDYFQGIPVTQGCNVIDDPFHEMGDPNEIMLKTALNYIDSGSCQ